MIKKIFIIFVALIMIGCCGIVFLKVINRGKTVTIGKTITKSDTNRQRLRTEPMEFREAVPIPEKPAQTSGTLQLILTKVKEVPDNRPLISAGVPFPKGWLTSEKDFKVVDKKGYEIPIAVKVLARWPQDNSIRSVLVQFHYNIDKIYEYLDLQWGKKRSVDDLPVAEPIWDYPEGFILLSKEWLCQSQIVGEQTPMGTNEFSAYDAKIEKFFDVVKDKPWTGEVNVDNYYSTPHVFYQFYVRSGDPKHFLAARKELLHYREKQIIHQGKNKGMSTGGNRPRYVYVQAMADDYFLTGDPRSLEVAGDMAEYLQKVVPPERAFYPKKSKKFWTERLIAFPFLGAITYYEMTGDQEYLQLSREYMENLYKTQLQWPARGGFIHNLYAHDPEEGAKKHEYGGSPFMTGLLLEAVVKYHRLTGDPKAADSIFRAADWLINEGLANNGKAFIYLTADKYFNSSGEADINSLIVHALGYSYRLSGYEEKKYMVVGQAAFDFSVNKAYVRTRKHFNQNFRSSGHYLAYIWDDLRRKTIFHDENVYYFAGFDYGLGNLDGQRESVLRKDNQNIYKNGNTLNVRSRYENSSLRVSLDLEGWNIKSYPKLSFSYRIPRGVPVGLRVLTQSDQWLCLGGTLSYLCDGYQVVNEIVLQDDGAWHEFDINGREAIHSVLPGISQVKSFQFNTHNNAGKTDQFWIDELKISK